MWLAFRDVDLEGLTRAFARYDMTAVAGMFLIYLPGYALQAFRLRFLCQREAALGACFNVVFLGFFLNNVLPAKLGELGKVVYLRQKVGFRGARSLAIVFWERFFDVNAIVLLAVYGAVVYQIDYLVYSLLLGVLVLWSYIALAHLRPGVVAALIRLVPGQQLRLFVGDATQQLQRRASPHFFGVLGLYTAVCLAHLIAFQAAGLYWLADLNLGLWDCLAASAVFVLGLILPTTPGALGVAEAAMVLALRPFYVPKETALALGLTLHMVIYIPGVLGGMLVLARSKFSISSLRQQWREPM